MHDELHRTADQNLAYLAAVEVLRRTVGTEIAPSYLLDPTGTRLNLVAEEPVRRELEPLGLASLPAIAHVRSPWIEDGEWPVSAADHLDSEAWAEFPSNFTEWFGNFGVVTPIFADGRHIGAVLLPYHEPHFLIAEERAYLAAAGRLLGSALYRWRLGARERELGALEERRTLGDELHVDLSQQVAALGLRIEKLGIDLREGSPGAARAEAEHLRTHVGLLKRSLRNLMLGLRSDAELVEGSFVATVERHLDNCRLLMGINAQLLCTGPDDCGSADAIPLSVAAQLVRVLQEALNNAWTHGRARSVTVRLMTGKTRIRMEVEDDGAGYQPTQVPDTRLGLRIMEERMAQVDGEFEILSGSEGGTIVVAQAPLQTDRAGVGWGS